MEYESQEESLSMRDKRQAFLSETTCIHVRFFGCIPIDKCAVSRSVPFRRHVYRNKSHSILDLVCAIATTMTSAKRHAHLDSIVALLATDINRNFIRDFRQHFRALLFV